MILKKLLNTILQWFDLIWLDILWFDIPWLDILWFDIPWFDIPWIDVPWIDVPWFDISWLDVPRFDIPWFDIPWFDIPWFYIPCFDVLTNMPCTVHSAHCAQHTLLLHTATCSVPFSPYSVAGPSLMNRNICCFSAVIMYIQCKWLPYTTPSPIPPSPPPPPPPHPNPQYIFLMTGYTKNRLYICRPSC